MKYSMLTLTAVFILLPMVATAEPDKKIPTSADDKPAVTHQLEESESTAFSATSKNVGEGSSTQWQEGIYEMAIDKVKADNIADTREAIAEDILLQQ